MDWLESGGLAQVFAALEKMGHKEVMEIKTQMQDNVDHEYEAWRVRGGRTSGGTSWGAAFEQNVPSCSSSAAGGRRAVGNSTPASVRGDEAFEQSIALMAAENDCASLVRDLKKFGDAGSRHQQQTSACAALSNVDFSPRDLQRQIKQTAKDTNK